MSCVVESTVRRGSHEMLLDFKFSTNFAVFCSKLVSIKASKTVQTDSEANDFEKQLHIPGEKQIEKTSGQVKKLMVYKIEYRILWLFINEKKAT